jgi:hypothetical protein
MPHDFYNIFVGHNTSAWLLYEKCSAFVKQLLWVELPAQWWRVNVLILKMARQILAIGKI